MSRKAWLLFLALGVIWGVPYLLIRVAVADRQEIAPPPLISIPLPPRRPPSLAFTPKDVEIPARQRLIGGAQPILADTQFSRSALAK